MPTSPLIWLKNTVRNRCRGSLLGRLLLGSNAQQRLTSLRIVCATRLPEKEFWRTSALGRSLKLWRSTRTLAIDVKFENKEGLPKIYNRYLRDAKPTEALVFMHDDVWLDDPEWLPKTMAALERFDIVGVAGCTQRVPQQPSWYFKALNNGQFTRFEDGVLSGAVGHGPLPGGQVSLFGPAPKACRLLDGLYLAMSGDRIRQSKVFFDERFSFHFYDVDFCRQADNAGLSLGTWPITLTHQSMGVFVSTTWKAGYDIYLRKWKS